MQQALHQSLSAFGEEGRASRLSLVQEAPKATTKAERRAVQERQRAEKKAAKARAQHDMLTPGLMVVQYHTTDQAAGLEHGRGEGLAPLNPKSKTLNPEPPWHPMGAPSQMKMPVSSFLQVYGPVSSSRPRNAECIWDLFRSPARMLRGAP